MKPNESITSRGDAHLDICVIGMGYVGLPTACILATKGKKVLGVDILPHVVDACNRGESHFNEPDLDILLKAAVHGGNLRASTAPEPADVYMIAVPTPFKDENGGLRVPDMSYVESGVRSIALLLKPGDIIILESTSSVGTTDAMRAWVADQRATAGFDPLSDQLHFAHCPERILPGQLLKELISNDRICGGLTREAAGRAAEIYRCFCTGEIHLTDARTAELAKLAENAYRDVNIAFANELSLICDHLKIDVWKLIELANKHPRVDILRPGPGVGGHCIAVDPWFIIACAPEHARLMKTARYVNDAKPQHVVEQIIRSADRFKEPVIACLGLMFKADVDDIRESPAYDIVMKLAKRKVGRLLIVEPRIAALPRELAGDSNCTLCGLGPAIDEADIVVLLVDHREFRRERPLGIDRKVLIDTRGSWQAPVSQF